MSNYVAQRFFSDQVTKYLRPTCNKCGLYRGFRDTGYLSFYLQGYTILSILLPGIWDTVFNILVTFRDIDYLGKLIMWIFESL